MKLDIDNMNDKFILTLGELEYTMMLNAIRAATGDDTRRGNQYFQFYNVDKGEMVAFYNSIVKAQREKS